MRVIFMGSGNLGCPALAGIVRAGRDQVTSVVTQPDRPKGRRRRIAACPVRQVSAELGIPSLTPADVNAPGSVDSLTGERADIIVVASYGQILSPAVLGLPPQGCINLHASLLPKYRGAAPVQVAIVRGERVTGVTTQFMAERMDAGDIIFRQEVAIGGQDTAGTLAARLADEGARLLLKTLDAIREGRAPRKPQVETEATFAPKLKKADGRIDWTAPAEAIYNKVRGYNPWPCCFCEMPAGSGKTLRVLETHVEPGEESARGAFKPGQVCGLEGKGPVVATGGGRLRLLSVQPEGKRAMAGSAYLCGHGLKVGDVLG